MARMEISKEIEVKGKTYKINKYKALEGGIIIKKIMNTIPELIEKLNIQTINLEDINMVDLLKAISSALAKIDDKDLEYIQKYTLLNTQILTAAGEVDILNENGSFAIADLEYDIFSVHSIIAQTLFFNLKDFFPESLSTLLNAEGLISNMQNVKT